MAICNKKPDTAAEACKIMERTVFKLAHQYARNHHQDFDDLVQRGYVGVMEAYNRFDDGKGMAFSSFAYQWIFPLIKDFAKGNWKVYNNTNAYVSAEDADEGDYEMDLDEAIDLKRKIERQDETTQKIVIGRLEGYSFREISEMLEKEGMKYTLHQVRNAYIQVMGNE